LAYFFSFLLLKRQIEIIQFRSSRVFIMRRVWRYLLLFCFNVHNYQAWRLYLPCLYIGNEVLEHGISERVKIDTGVTLWIHISSISAPGLILRGQFTNIIHIKMYRHIILKQIICLLRKQSHQFKKKIIICSWKKYKSNRWETRYALVRVFSFTYGVVVVVW
jgi:hypothetical protein